jgi:polysaccharide biosynthesis protein PelF
VPPLDPTVVPLTDVCLVLEGTYPYVQGGVSTWVHDLIRSLPELTFGLVHIGPEPAAYQRRRYALPENVVYLDDLYCREVVSGSGERAMSTASDARVRDDDVVGRSLLLRGLRRLQLDSDIDAQLLEDLGAGDLSVAEFLCGSASFRLVRELYQQLAPVASFPDIFWHVRSMYLPLVRLLRKPAPQARRYHALCTGYAGLLAAVWSQRTDRPLILTEHGIYLRERALELYRAVWVRGNGDGRLGFDRATAAAIDALWMRFFRTLARCAYFRATAIVSLSEVSRRRQVEDGAPDDKTLVVPNGVDADALLARLGETPRKRVSERVRVGFVGRLVPIKDAVTFLRACEIAARWVDLGVRVIGPEDEDAVYAFRCRRLAAELGLGNVVRFEGAQPIERIYPELDILVLTSFSEGQPLVILEAGAAGLPVIASDVGACRELIYGRSELDRQLGPSGIITHLAAPVETAVAMMRLARNPQMRARMGAIGRERVRRFYRHNATIARYRVLYEEVDRPWPASAGA